MVNTFVGGDAAQTVDANWKEAEKVWPEIIRFARGKGVTLAFENCPMLFSASEWPGGHNIAYSPLIWRRIFEAWGSDVGINYDPSHLVWQMIDGARFIREFRCAYAARACQGFADRSRWSVRARRHVGRHRLADSAHAGAWRGGLENVLLRLYRAGYDGPVVIEHEDRQFEGSDDK